MIGKVGDEVLVDNKALIDGMLDRLVHLTDPEGHTVLARIIECNETVTSVKIVPNTTKD